MSAPLPKPRKRIRIERPEPAHGGHDDGHSWAVSYADLLMVLLSFFITFFSIDENKRSELIDQIKAGVPLEGNASVLDPTRQPAAALNVGIASVGHLPKGLAAVFTSKDGLLVEQGKDARNLSIVFADNLYKMGQIDLPKKDAAKLRDVLAQLKPYQDQINIVFIGHTDKARVKDSHSLYLRDNFGISSLRAVSALRFAAQSGMDPARMYTKGVAEHSRGSRTLSLLITPREVEQ